MLTPCKICGKYPDNFVQQEYEATVERLADLDHALDTLRKEIQADGWDWFRIHGKAMALKHKKYGR